MNIAVIGGGASGVLAALHLHEQLPDEARITIFDPQPLLGAGLAYGTDHEAHLLNVPAERMGYHPARADDFNVYLGERDRGRYAPFVPRRWYREYLGHLLARVPAGRITHERKRVDAVTGDFPFFATVIATGYVPRTLWPLSPRVRPAFGKSPADLSDRDQVVILGTGLSAIDVWRQLRGDGFGGVAHFRSRRGLIPLAHEPSSSIGIPSLAGRLPREILRALRRQAPASWAMVADGLRVQANAIWQHWSARERGAFERHLKPYWEIIRHRLPAPVWQEFATERERGRVTVKRGRLRKVTESSTRVHMTFDHEEMAAAYLFLATGAPIEQIAVRNEHARIFRLGPALRPSKFETTAIPEIRVQAFEIARRIRELTEGREV